jgi:hypothetical protein
MHGRHLKSYTCKKFSKASQFKALCRGKEMKEYQNVGVMGPDKARLDLEVTVTQHLGLQHGSQVCVTMAPTSGNPVN